MTRLHPLGALLAAWLAAAAAVSAQVLGPAFVGLPSSDALFDDSVVHEIRLLVNERDWQTLKDRYLENDYYPADFHWRNHIVRNVGIRSRGTGSRSPVKPGLKVAFDRYVGGQTFLGLQSIVLRNNTQDPSNIRERVSMQLFDRVGVPAPRESFVRFFVNDEYIGLYTIVETIDDRFLARRFRDSDGYLFSFDYPAGAAPFYFEDRGAEPSAYVPQPFKPETHSSDPRADIVARMVQAVNLSSDAAFESAAGEFVDIRAAIRQVAAESFLADDDGFNGDYGMNNVYAYRSTRSTMFTFLPWDKSNVTLHGVDASIWRNITDVPAASVNRLVARAMRVPRFRQLYLDTLDACARAAGEPDGTGDERGWMEREVLREYAQIHDAAQNDRFKPFTNDEFESGVEELRVFAAERGAHVTAEVKIARLREQEWR